MKLHSFSRLWSPLLCFNAGEFMTRLLSYAILYPVSDIQVGKKYIEINLVSIETVGS